MKAFNLRYEFYDENVGWDIGRMIIVAENQEDAENMYFSCDEYAASWSMVSCDEVNTKSLFYAY